jgi:hypothetical protein
MKSIKKRIAECDKRIARIMKWSHDNAKSRMFASAKQERDRLAMQIGKK